MDKTDNLRKEVSGALRQKRGVLLFCALLLLSAAGFTPCAAAMDERHVVIEQNDVRARRPGYDIGPKNLRQQPVFVRVPEGVLVEIASETGFMANSAVPNLFGLLQGEVYRFKLSHLPYAEGRELYPTLELLSTLTPPSGYETDFPIPIELSEEDIRMALEGNLVTRVVYLEPPHNAIPVDSTVRQGEILSEAPASADPVSFAKSRGRVMAILRLGSRIPDPQADLSAFCFGYPAAAFPEKPSRPLGYPLNGPRPDGPAPETDSVRKE